MCDCSNIILPTGPTGAQGPQGIPGVDGVDGASLLDTIFSRPSTSALSLSEITSIPIDVSKVFIKNGDGLEYEIAFSYNHVSGNSGGNVQVSLEDGVNSIGLIPSTPAVNTDLEACVISGTIIKVSNSAINHNYTLYQPADSIYSAPRNTITNLTRGVYETITNPGIIDNTSVNLKLSAKGILNAGTNNIKVEFFKLKSIFKLV